MCIAGGRSACFQKEQILINEKKLITVRSKRLLQAHSWKGCAGQRPDTKPAGVGENAPPNSEVLVNMVLVKPLSDVLNRPQSSSHFSVSAEIHQLLVNGVFGFAGIALRVPWLRSL